MPEVTLPIGVACSVFDLVIVAGNAFVYHFKAYQFLLNAFCFHFFQ